MLSKTRACTGRVPLRTHAYDFKHLRTQQCDAGPVHVAELRVIFVQSGFLSVLQAEPDSFLFDGLHHSRLTVHEPGGRSLRVHRTGSPVRSSISSLL